MTNPIRLLSTDFDGTLFAEFEDPPVPLELQELIGTLQKQGAQWVINTGRDLSSLLESLGRAHLTVKPDHLVLVEREIYFHEESQYVEVAAWNRDCTNAHAELFVKVRQDLPQLVAWINEHFTTTIYEDVYSPFCLIAEHNEDADRIHEYLNDYCRTVPSLTVMRNDIYARFSHEDYNKGTALSEIARRLNIGPEGIVAAGDHLNDVPMLHTRHATRLIAPGNAIPFIKTQVIEQGGFVSDARCGWGVLEGLRHFLALQGVDKF